MDERDFQDKLDHKVCLVSRVNLDLQVPLGQQDRQDYLAKLDRLDLDSLDRQVSLVVLANEVVQDPMALLVRRAYLDQMEPLVTKVALGNQDHLDFLVVVILRTNV